MVGSVQAFCCCVSQSCHCTVAQLSRVSTGAHSPRDEAGGCAEQHLPARSGQFAFLWQTMPLPHLYRRKKCLHWSLLSSDCLRLWELQCWHAYNKQAL